MESPGAESSSGAEPTPSRIIMPSGEVITLQELERRFEAQQAAQRPGDPPASQFQLQ